MSFNKIDESLPANICTFNMMVKCKLQHITETFVDMIYYIIITNKNCDQLCNIEIGEYVKEEYILLKVFVTGLQINVTIMKNGSISICGKNMTCIVKSLEMLYTMFNDYNIATYSSYFNPLENKNIGNFEIKHIGGIYRLFNDDSTHLIDLYDLHRMLVENKYRCMSIVSVGINTELTCLHIKYSDNQTNNMEQNTENTVNNKEHSIYIFSKGTVVAIDLESYKQLIDCYNFVVQITKDYIFSANNLHNDLVNIKSFSNNANDMDITNITSMMDSTRINGDSDINNLISSMDTVCL